MMLTIWGQGLGVRTRHPDTSVGPHDRRFLLSVRRAQEHGGDDRKGQERVSHHL